MSAASCERAPAPWVDGALRESAGGGHRVEEGGGQVHGAGGEQFPIAVDLLFAGLPDAARNRRGLQEDHHRDRKSPADKAAELAEGGQRRRARARLGTGAMRSIPALPEPSPKAISAIEPTTTTS